MEDLLERVKAVDLRSVIEDLGFKIVQNRRLKCPFHEDDSPSLVIYPPPQNEFHCFGCGKHGDVINFYSEINGLDFRTSLEQLALRYVPGYENEGLKAIKNQPKQQVYEKREPEKSYVYQPKHADIYEDFQQKCLNYPVTESTIAAAKYLRDRGISDWTTRHFKVFFIKNYRDANRYLQDTYSMADLQACGLMNEKGNLVFYVHPIIFPYYNDGRIVYLQGRTVGPPKDKAAKYQFLKGVPRPMFNRDILSNLTSTADVYITEGAMDCMTLFQRGMSAVSLGSAKHFRPEWAKLFQRFRVWVWFDNDVAGQQGTLDLMETLYLNGISVHRKYIPPGFNDINEYFRSLN